MSAFAARGYETAGYFREEEADTVAYSGPHLAELIAASGETSALTDFDVSVETTVVIPGSRPRATAESIAPVTTSLSTEVSAMTSMSAMSAMTRRGNALALAAAGLFFGMLMATSLTQSAPRASRSSVQAQKHELTHETKALVSPLHTKAVPKRLGHPTFAPTPIYRTSASTNTKVAPPRPSTEADDSQLVEERRLVLAAQLERSL